MFALIYMYDFSYNKGLLYQKAFQSWQIEYQNADGNLILLFMNSLFLLFFWGFKITYKFWFSF